MAWLHNKYLLLPLLGFALVFGLDKIFLLESVQRYTVPWNKIEPLFYASRADLFEQLVAEQPERKTKGERLGLILGSSRAGEFDPEHFRRYLPDSYVYNFSAPLACPAFHYYWLERILGAGIEPSFLIVEADPALLGERSLEFAQKYSLDASFVRRYTDLNREVENPWSYEGPGFSYNEAESYFLLRAFALHRYPFDPRTVRANLRNKQGRQIRDFAANLVGQANREKLGSIPNPLLAQNTEEQMRADALAMAELYLEGYAASPTQVRFFKRILRTAAEREIPVIVYWPLSSEAYAKQMQSHRMDRKVQEPLGELVDAANAGYPVDSPAKITLVDLQDDPRMQCRAFVDSHHLSGACFPQLTERLVEPLPATLKR